MILIDRNCKMQIYRIEEATKMRIIPKIEGWTQLLLDEIVSGKNLTKNGA